MRNCEPWFSYDIDAALGMEGNYLEVQWFGFMQMALNSALSALVVIPLALGCSGINSILHDNQHE